jgi:hypothetical protein
MKKAVITTGGKQYVVAEGDTVTVERLKDTDKGVKFDALLVIDGDKTTIGAPLVSGVSVSASVVDGEAPRIPGSVFCLLQRTYVWGGKMVRYRLKPVDK